MCCIIYCSVSLMADDGVVEIQSGAPNGRKANTFITVFMLLLDRLNYSEQLV